MNSLTNVNILLIIFLILIILINSNANRLVYNWLNVTSSHPERLKVLDFGFDTRGSMNMSIEFLVPMDNVSVSEM